MRTLASWMLANFTSSVLKVIGATAATSGSSRSCSASGGVSSRRLRYLKKSPRMIQGNLVTYIEFPPRLDSCWAKEAFSPWMMPTMARRVHTPMPIPTVVSRVRRRLARSARTAIFPPSTTSMRIPIRSRLLPRVPEARPPAAGRLHVLGPRRRPRRPARLHSSPGPVPLHPAPGGGPGLLHLLEAAGPVLLEEARQRAVGEEPAPGLAGRGSSWSRCRRGRCAAPASRSPGRACRYRPCTAIAVAEGGDLLGEAAPGLRAEPVGPGPEHVAGRLVEPADLVVVEPLRERDRRQPRRGGGSRRSRRCRCR